MGNLGPRLHQLGQLGYLTTPDPKVQTSGCSILRGKSESSAFIDLGDQFLGLQKGRRQPADDGRHLGLVVDDKGAVREALADTGIEPLPGPFLDFVDPWGNRIEIVGYDNIQFTKAPNVLRGMGLEHLSKNKTALKELTDKGMGPD